MAATTIRPARRSLAADIILAALLLGPLAAPFLALWGLLIPRAVSGIIYTLGAFICPQPAHGLPLYHGQIMAVCMRCYGTALGLALTRLLYSANRGAVRVWLPGYGVRGLSLFAALIFAYPAEFAGEVAGLWPFDEVAVTAAGLLSGAGLGLMLHPLLRDR